ncbi:MAG TPA: DUF1080 domain-containing protein [Candidatus Didemnitutus sp.]
MRIALAFLAVVCLSARGADDFVPLCDGKDLSGWHVKDGRSGQWTATGEILRCAAGPVGENGGGWLTSDREYGDFVLRVEWRIPAGGNSGIGLRYPADGEPAHEGMEIQLLDDASPDNAKRPAVERSGSIFAELAPARNADHPPGQWNRTEITCRGPSLTVRTNGVETLSVNLDDLTVRHTHHQQYRPVSARPRRGSIGLQGDRGPAVEFRHIEIRELGGASGR